MDFNIIINIVLAMIAITSLILLIRQYKRKKPVWAYSTRHIIGRDAEAPPELKYVFGTREVSEVYKTTIIFFNKGTDKFCGDLVHAGNSDLNEAIIIQFKGAEILRPPTIPKRSKGVVNFSVEQVENCADSVKLHIPILNHNDGAVIEVWHTQCSEIDIPNADITQMKEFVRHRPEGFYGNIAVPFVLLAVFIWLLFSEIVQGELLSDYLPLLIIAVALFVISIWGLNRQLRYRAFPSWSRIKEKAQKE